MSYDWYSGSDPDGNVPDSLERYYQHSDNWSKDERVEFLASLLESEQNPNWRAHLYYLIGAEHLISKDYSSAVDHFVRAEECFDPLADSFSDVSSSYCRTRFALIREKFMDEEEDELTVSYALSILCWMNDDVFTEYEHRLLLNALGFSLASIADSLRAPLFNRLALEVRQRATQLDEDPHDALESLFLSALALEDRELCERILERLSRAKQDSMVNELRTMLTNHLGDSGPTN